MNKLNQIIEICNGSVYLTINDHKSFYNTVERHFIEREEYYEDIDKNTKQKMIEKDTIITIKCYLHTPIGFFVVHGISLDDVISEALKICNDNI